MLTSSRATFLPSFRPLHPSQSPQGHRNVWKALPGWRWGARSGDTTWYPPSLLALLGSPWHFKLLGRRGEEQFAFHVQRLTQRAMPGSLYVFTQLDNQRRWQSQYRGLASDGPGLEERGQTLQLHGVPHPLGTRYQTLCPELAEP